MIFLSRKIYVTLYMLMLVTFSTWANYILLPMDEVGQKDHLKAYGITYWSIQKQRSVKWLLNYRGGAFLLPDTPDLRNECKIRGVTYEILSDSQTQDILSFIASPSQNMEAIILEKAPKVAVYTPKGKHPWDDAVTMVLTYAEIPYDKVYDREVLQDELLVYDWLHLHHEDFTGQYGKFYKNYRSSHWYIENKREQEHLAKELGYAKVSQEKLAVAKKIRDYVIGGGFMFAMCSATDSFDIALSADGVDICEAVFDGDQSQHNYQEYIDYKQTFAFKNFQLEKTLKYEFSDIDMTSKRENVRKELDYFSLKDYSAKWDPIPTMLCQNHTSLVKGFMGQTTAFDSKKIKSNVLILGQNKINNEARYIHGIKGKGFFTFYGGHLSLIHI